MGIPFRCECGQEGQVPEVALHQYVKCPGCNRTSYIGSRKGTAVPVVHRTDRARRSLRRLVGRAALVGASIAVAAGLAYGLIRDRGGAPTTSRLADEDAVAAVPREPEPDRIVMRIQRELRADHTYKEQYDRLRQRLIEDYREIERHRRALRLEMAEQVGSSPELLAQDRRLLRQQDQVHQLYLDWAFKVDKRVRDAVPEASPTLVSHWVSKFYPEPTMAEIRKAEEEAADD